MTPLRILALALLAGPALAQQASAPAAPAPAPAPPWSERAIAEHLDFAALAREVEAEGAARLIAAGERLFSARFTTPDGAGRPLATQADIPTRRRRPAERMFQRLAGLDANSCASCHFQPAAGGAGPFTVNAFSADGIANADFDSLDPQYSNERGTTAMFGAGLVELLAREMTAELQAARRAALAEARASGAPVTVPLAAKGVGFGRLTALPDGVLDLAAVDGVDPDLVVRPFGQKGVFTSLRQFTVNVLNAHHGMQATERFGPAVTGEADFDGDGVTGEVTAGDVAALVGFQAALPAPLSGPPPDPVWAAAAARGREEFGALGCAACHIPALPLQSLIFEDPSPYDAAGVLRPGDVAAPIRLDLGALPWVAALPRDAAGRTLVPLLGDLRRHVIADAEVATLGNELLGQRFVERDVFMTAELWGVGLTAPYGHRGDLTTLDEVIGAHGGEARPARDAYLGADDATRAAVVAFLRSLGRFE